MKNMNHSWGIIQRLTSDRQGWRSFIAALYAAAGIMGNDDDDDDDAKFNIYHIWFMESEKIPMFLSIYHWYTHLCPFLISCQVAW